MKLKDRNSLSVVIAISRISKWCIYYEIYMDNGGNYRMDGKIVFMMDMVKYNLGI